jgi:hypothetical protein
MEMGTKMEEDISFRHEDITVTRIFYCLEKDIKMKRDTQRRKVKNVADI